MVMIIGVLLYVWLCDGVILLPDDCGFRTKKNSFLAIHKTKKGLTSQRYHQNSLSRHFSLL